MTLIVDVPDPDDHFDRLHRLGPTVTVWMTREAWSYYESDDHVLVNDDFLLKEIKSVLGRRVVAWAGNWTVFRENAERGVWIR